MTEPGAVTVPPRLAKMLGTLAVANLAVAGGIFMVVGWGRIQTVVCALAVGLSTIRLVVAAVRQRPQVVITSEGFAFHRLFAGRTHKWEDIDGPFAVIKIGISNVVAYKLTADNKARVGKKPASRLSGFQGYDEVIMGDFQLSAEELAELLNERKKRSLPSRDEGTRAVSPAETSVAAPPASAGEARATGNDSPILRVAAGVMAVLFAGVAALNAAAGKASLSGLALMGALALMFGWYAVRGRKGLPRFFTRKLGEPAAPSSTNKRLITVVSLIAVAVLLWYVQGGREKTRAQKAAEDCFNQGLASCIRGQYDSAIRDLTRAIELKPDFAAAYGERGIAYQDKGRYDLSIRDLTRAIELEPGHARRHVNRGYTYRLMGRLDLAIRDYTKAIELKPDYVDAYCNRGLAHSDKGEHDPALRDFARAIELDPRCADAYRARGVEYDKQGKYDPALADLTRAIELNRNDAVAYGNRGLVYSDKSELDKAVADYTEAIRLDPAMFAAYGLRGAAYVAKGDYDKAVADLTKAIELKPDYAENYCNRGFAYGRKGEHDRAIADCSKAVELKPDYAEAYHGRAIAQYYLKAYDKAWADVKKCRELGGAVDTKFIEELTRVSGRSE